MRHAALPDHMSGAAGEPGIPVRIFGTVEIRTAITVIIEVVIETGRDKAAAGVPKAVTPQAMRGKAAGETWPCRTERSAAEPPRMSRSEAARHGAFTKAATKAT